MVEHIGNVMAIGATCNRDFVKSPGLVRTLIGDGLAACFAVLLGIVPRLGAFISTIPSAVIGGISIVLLYEFSEKSRRFET